jgi:hypothetical protein
VHTYLTINSYTKKTIFVFIFRSKLNQIENYLKFSQSTRLCFQEKLLLNVQDEFQLKKENAYLHRLIFR